MDEFRFQDSTYHSLPDSGQKLAQLLAQCLPTRSGPLRLLDIGCSSGVGVMALSELFPDAMIAGVDVSKSNIQIVREQIKGHKEAYRLRFAHCDYHAFHDGMWDGIFANSTLHLIPDPDALFRKIASELRTGGVLVMSVPKKSLYNSSLIFLRRLYRFFRCPTLDRAITSLALLIHPNISLQFIAERMEYMRIIPFFIFDEQWKTTLSEMGLNCLRETPQRRVFGKPDHVMLAFVKVQAPARHS